jgi:hypothetical protein
MMKRSIRGIQWTLGLAALWFVPATANAQVTISSVKVTISSATSTAVYCDTSLHCSGAAPGNGNVEVWDLGGGVNLLGGQTLVLTQTGLIANLPGGNFDTSDRVRIPTGSSVGPFEADCTKSDPCSVAIEINGVQVYSAATAVALTAFNNDTTSPEGSQWAAPIVLKPNYTLALGYADNEHGASFFPTPWLGSVTVFKGAGNGALGTCSSNCYDAGALLITGVTVPVTATGRMTGGGSVFTSAGIRVTHGFEIHCDVTDVPNNLEINWDGGNNFHLDVLDTAVCTQTPAIQAPPNAPFDTFKGTGTGKLNSVPGATIEFTFVDGGEPGTKDTATYLIKNAQGTQLFVGTTFLTKGNQQAHK